MKPDRSRPISLEDLLRLKRAERPPAEFWSEFDRKLRAKQLAALVEKRPWWQTLPSAFSGLARYRIHLGAAAAVGLTFVTVRQHWVDVETPAQPASAPVVVAAVEPQVASPSIDVAPASAPTVSAPVLVAQSEPDSTPTTVAASTVSAAELSRLISLGGASGRSLEIESEADSPVVRTIGTTVTVAQTIDPAIPNRLFASTSGFEARAMPARTVIEPLQQMSLPSETRRARMLTAMVSMASMEAPARTAERAANRIAEENLYDEIRRFGARGAGVQMKF
jgi:hypothetical protein